MNRIQRFEITTHGRSTHVTGEASYEAHDASATRPNQPLRPLRFDLHVRTRDLNALADMLDRPDLERSPLPCRGVVGDGDTSVPIVALRSRFSTLTKPGTDPHLGNVWLEYIDESTASSGVPLGEAYTSAFLDITRTTADRLSRHLTQATPALTVVRD